MMMMVDESPTVSVKGLISKVLEDHRSRADPPLLLKNGSQFKKNLEVIISQKQPPESICCSNAGQTRHKACENNVPCAGRALRNAFLSNGQDNWKAHIKLARIIRRTYIGLELVEWLMDRCEFIRNRTIASKIWNILLDLGILLSVEQNNVFEDSRSLYQFTFEECEAQSCDFRNQVNWPSAVHLLLQLVPYVQLRGGTQKHYKEDAQKTSDVCNPVLQMRALEHLTSTVQNELLAALARKAQTKSVMEESSPQQNTNTPGSSPSPAVRKGPGTATRDREDISRLEMVQRLAKDGCRLLHSPLRATERPAEPSSDAAVRVCERERSHEVLLPQRTTSLRAAPSSSSWTGRYAAVPAAPEKVLEHLLGHLRLDEEQKSPQSRETENLLIEGFLRRGSL
ncbi:rap guanine nucleotide exchange factor 5-like [Sinocyclocheilus anshuiensis]|uniref:rap guanine nucleotide exchange factor 5-like n=1 Tax=Sinocyclocheilus anshuiensis TaxID=1608454 RepID=UPI0007B891E7|nr:PREDICTED: rap guanine nucleotide exchange factor 5-like [Sinocyclocheilus anshuiensis]